MTTGATLELVLVDWLSDVEEDDEVELEDVIVDISVVVVDDEEEDEDEVDSEDMLEVVLLTLLVDSVDVEEVDELEGSDDVDESVEVLELAPLVLLLLLLLVLVLVLVIIEPVLEADEEAGVLWTLVVVLLDAPVTATSSGSTLSHSVGAA